MAGHVVSLYLRENNFNVDTLSANNALDKNTILVDVRDATRFEQVLSAKKYNIIINCIGLLVKDSEHNRDLAVYLNSYLPLFLENRYINSDTKIIHISTDGVFSGKNPPYSEDSATDSESFYGRTKAMGEIINNKDLTLRTSILGPDIQANGTGLLNWFMGQNGEISGYTTAMWKGITTLELAKSIGAVIDQDLKGIYHLVPKDSISKFNLLQLFKDTFNRIDVTVNPTQGTTTNATLINTRTDFNHQIPDYKTMLYDMKNWIKDHSELYMHYEK